MEILYVNSSVCSFSGLLLDAESHVLLHESSGCLSSLAFLPFRILKKYAKQFYVTLMVYIATVLHLFVYTHTYIKLFLKIRKVTKSWAWPRFLIPWFYPHLPAPSLPERLLPPQPSLPFKSPCISKLKTAVVQIKGTTLDQQLQIRSFSHFFEVAEEVTISNCVISVVFSCSSYIQHGRQHYRTEILMLPFSVIEF